MATWTERKKLVLLMAFHVSWGGVLGWSISKYGMGVSTDSVIYMFAATNWVQGKGLVSFNGAPYWPWPPLYPLVMALIQAVSGLSAFVAAHMVQFAAFLLFSFFVSLLFLRIFEGDFLWAALACFTWSIGPVVVSTFQMVGSDYVYALFMAILAVLSGTYARTQKWVTSLLMALLATLAALQRHIGFVDVAVTGATLLVLTRGGWRRRVSRALPVVICGVAPFLWLVRSWRFLEGRWRAPLTFGEYFEQFSIGILRWFVEPSAIEANYTPYAALLWSALALLVVALIVAARWIPVFTPYTAPLLGYGVLYTLVLFGNALRAYFNRLWGRFQLPIYLPLLLLLYLVLYAGWSILRRRPALSTRALAWALPLILLLPVIFSMARTTVRLLRDAHDGIIPENAYNTRPWAENLALQYWKAHSPQGEYLLFANYPAGVAFHTGHWVYASPRKYSTPYSTERIPLRTYQTRLFASGKDVYLLWIEPNTYEHLYRVDELTPIADVDAIFVGEDGGVYRLSPR